jgi:hypothetical protein
MDRTVERVGASSGENTCRGIRVFERRYAKATSEDPVSTELNSSTGCITAAREGEAVGAGTGFSRISLAAEGSTSFCARSAASTQARRAPLRILWSLQAALLAWVAERGIPAGASAEGSSVPPLSGYILASTARH